MFYAALVLALLKLKTLWNNEKLEALAKIAVTQ